MHVVAELESKAIMNIISGDLCEHQTLVQRKKACFVPMFVKVEVLVFEEIMDILTTREPVITQHVWLVTYLWAS